MRLGGGGGEPGNRGGDPVNEVGVGGGEPGNRGGDPVNEVGGGGGGGGSLETELEGGSLVPRPSSEKSREGLGDSLISTCSGRVHGM